MINPFNTISLLSYVVTLTIGLIGHELAHAYACVFRGGTVLKITLGKAGLRPPMSFQFLGFQWQIHSFSLRGAAHGFFSNPKTYRADILIFIAAAPLFNLICALIPLHLLLSYPDDSPIYSFSFGWIGSSIILIGASVIPSERPGYHASDGALFLKFLKMSDKDIAASCALSAQFVKLLHSNKKLANYHPGKLISLYQSNPSDIEPLQSLVVRLNLLQDPRELDYLALFVHHPNFPPTEGAWILDNYLSRQLLLGKTHKNPDARYDLLSQKLLEVGNSITVEGTRGSVLIDLGRVEEGKALLQKVLAESTSGIDLLYSHVFLALAEQRQGNLEAAQNHEAKARDLAPKDPILYRLQSPPAKVVKAPPPEIPFRSLRGLALPSGLVVLGSGLIWVYGEFPFLGLAAFSLLSLLIAVVTHELAHLLALLVGKLVLSRYYRSRMILFYAAGPISNLGLIFIPLVSWQFFPAADLQGINFVLAGVFVNSLIFGLTVVPNQRRTNDGAMIIETFQLSDEEVKLRRYRVEP